MCVQKLIHCDQLIYSYSKVTKIKAQLKCNGLSLFTGITWLKNATETPPESGLAFVQVVWPLVSPGNYPILLSIVCTFFIENDAEIFHGLIS